MKKIFLQHSLLLLPLVFLFWLVVYPNTLRWMEGVSFFSVLPDFTQLQVRYAEDYPDYVGAFLLQFYRWPVLGALIQTLFAWVVMLSVDVILYRLVRRQRLMWLTFVVVGAMLSVQVKYHELGEVIIFAVGALLLAGLVTLFTSNKGWIKSEKPTRLTHYVLPLVLMVLGCVASYSTKEYRVREKIYRLEHLAEGENWDKILEVVTHEVSANDQVARRYALLALLEKGMLSNKMFSYTITSADDFYFPHSLDFIGLSFNGYFSKSIGANNEAIHSYFQLNSIARFGYSARSLRGIVDALLRQGDDVLAEKYIRILLSSATNKSWAKTRIQKLRELKLEPQVEPTPESDIWSVWHGENPVVIESAGLLEADPMNRKVADVLCCALLASRQLPEFLQILDSTLSYASKGMKSLPLHYEEAVLLMSRQDPSLLQHFPVGSFKYNEFNRFAQMMDAKNSAGAREAFKGTFWAYYYTR